MFKGSWVALVTPYHQDYSIDQKSLKRLVEWHISEGTQGIVVGGSTGEGILLQPKEHHLIVKTCVESAQGRIPIVASVSAIQLNDSLKLAHQAQEIGVAGLMIAPPPYVKPTQDAIINFFSSVHDQTNLPLIIYNNPGRCSVTISCETIFELAKLPRVLCLKDASGQVSEISILKARLCENFTQLCGEDALNVASLAEGADGWISVTANIVPRLCAQLFNAWHQQDLITFAEIRDLLNPLHRALFIETSPSPIKYALSRQGLCHDNVRLPLLKATPFAQKALDQALNFIDEHTQKFFPLIVSR